MKRINSLWLAYIVGLVVMLVTAKLGMWQLHRAKEKAERMAVWESADRHPPSQWVKGAIPENYRRVKLSGQWLLAQQIVLDNRVENGQPGFHVITPFVLTPIPGEPTRIVTVNRGWLPKLKQALPFIAKPVKETIEVRVMPLPRFFELQKDKENGTLWQNLDWPRLQSKIGEGLVPMYTLAVSDLEDGLERRWPIPDLGRERNQGYAIQWFSLSGLTLFLIVFFTIRRCRQAPLKEVKDAE